MWVGVSGTYMVPFLQAGLGEAEGFPWPKVVPGAGCELAGTLPACVCMCACVQCDSGVGKPVLGGSSFL